MGSRRVNVKAILADPDLRRKLMVPTIQATQAREGIDTTPEQADRAYYVVSESEKAVSFGLKPYRGIGSTPEQREEMFVRALRGEAPPRLLSIVRRADFLAIEGAPLIFESIGLVGHLFREHPPLGQAITTHQGVTTRDDSRFLRFWWEVCPRRKQRPWVRFFKGGDFSRFYSDTLLSIDWSSSAQSMFWRRRDPSIYFKDGLTWPRANHVFNVRKLPNDSVFADKGPGLFPLSGHSLDFLSGLLNSELIWYLMSLLNKYDHWEMRALDLMPLPAVSAEVRDAIESAAKTIHDEKRVWDEGNELANHFVAPWLLRLAGTTAVELPDLASRVLHAEEVLDKKLQTIYARLNDNVYRLYGVPSNVRDIVDERLGSRPAEVAWPQMAGKTTEQKRMEHVWRLLCYAVKRVLEADDDGIVSFNAVNGEPRLVERVRHELATLFPDRDANQVEVEIVNELRRAVKGYRKCASLEEWLDNAFFEYHCALYKSRPVFWHIASAQGTAPFAFGALVHYHRFDNNRIAKLRASYLRDAIEEFRREAGLADKAGRTDDRIEWQAKVEEAQALDKKLQLIQEGHHEGSEGGERDYRILTPWKAPGERPKGWDPDLDDGVKVNIEPFEKAGAMRLGKVT